MSAFPTVKASDTRWEYSHGFLPLIIIATLFSFLLYVSSLFVKFSFTLHAPFVFNVLIYRLNSPRATSCV